MTRKQQLAHQMLGALREGLSVEDLLDSVAMAVAAKLELSRMEPSPRYRRELSIFYKTTLRRLHAARRQTALDGNVARRLSWQ